MRPKFLVIVAALLLVGAGCAPKGRAVMATRDMLPTGLVIMPGLEPYDEKSWTLEGEPGSRIMVTHWRTSALFDRVELFYRDMVTKRWGLNAHTVEYKDSVRIFWGLGADVRAADRTSRQYISIAKAQVDGKTDVEVVIEPKVP